ncbi:VOC family protein [Ligilactobacillus equi]
MKVKRIERLTITVSDLKAAQRFYHEVFDMPTISESDDNITLRCGHNELILSLGQTETSRAKKTTPGSADLRLVVGDNMEDILNHLKSYFVNILGEPVTKQGIDGQIFSVNITDDDGNLIEVSTYSNR